MGMLILITKVISLQQLQRALFTEPQEAYMAMPMIKTQVLQLQQPGLHLVLTAWPMSEAQMAKVLLMVFMDHLLEMPIFNTPHSLVEVLFAPALISFRQMKT